MRLRGPCARANLIALTLAGCVGNARPVSSGTLPETLVDGCVVEGAPLESFAPPDGYCQNEAPSEPYADALRLYQQERYAEALTRFEAVLAPGPEPADPFEWQAARFWAARTQAHLGREADTYATFVDIVRTSDDPFRWAAAGWLCGDRRPAPSTGDRACARPSEASTPTASDPYARDPGGGVPRVPHLSWLSHITHDGWTAYRSCDDGRHSFAWVTFVFESSGRVQSVRVRDENHDDIEGTPLAACVDAIATRVWIPPFAAATYEYEVNVVLHDPSQACNLGPTPCARDVQSERAVWHARACTCGVETHARVHIAATMVSDGTIQDLRIEGTLDDGSTLAGTAFESCLRSGLGRSSVPPFTDPMYRIEDDLDLPESFCVAIHEHGVAARTRESTPQ